jgi:hypothetical protein
VGKKGLKRTNVLQSLITRVHARHSSDFFGLDEAPDAEGDHHGGVQGEEKAGEAGDGRHVDDWTFGSRKLEIADVVGVVMREFVMLWVVCTWAWLSWRSTSRRLVHSFRRDYSHISFLPSVGEHVRYVYIGYQA